MRKILLAAVVALLPAVASAQVYLPPGVSLPPQSVIGNTLPVSGNAVAVSFAQFGSSLGVPAQKICPTSQWFNALLSAGVLQCLQPAITDISGLGGGVATFLGAASSANLRDALTDETGTGSAVFATSPTLVNPNLGTPSAATLTNATGLPISGVTGLGAGMASFLGSPTSANLRATMTDETGTGAAYFQGGDIGTPSAGVGTNITSLNASNISSGSLSPARLGLSQITASLGGDVNLTVSNQFVDGPSIAQGSTGTWWVSGSVVLVDTTALATFSCKLWDGTTVVDAGQATTQGAGLTYTMALSGFLATPASNLRISCSDTNGTPAGKIKFNATGTSKDSTISAFRIN